MKLEQPKWNYEPCEATLGSVIVGKSPRSSWWCADLEGQRVNAIQIICKNSEPFYIYDDLQARAKVFLQGGGPDSGHKSLPDTCTNWIKADWQPK